MGELHVVFCALKLIGRLIDESGLDQAFDERGKRPSHALLMPV